MKTSDVLFLPLFLFLPFRADAQSNYATDVFSRQIKTLQVRVAGETASVPCIPIEGDRRIEINFDSFGEGYTHFAYRIIHCNSDWSPSQLSPIEYMDGFQGLPVEDFASSIGTTAPYMNYRLFLPNDDIRFKVSGNYAVQVYREEDPEQILLTACFSVVEPLIRAEVTVSGNTDIDTNREHQQVGFTLDCKNFPISYPQTDLKIVVRQNNRPDNAVSGLQPTGISEGRITYTNSRNLIFPAGNEYRRMEFLSDKYNGMHVEEISFHNPYYNVGLMTDYARGQTSYQYDQDQNGRMFVGCGGCEDPDTEADYYIVHFALACDPLPGGSVHLQGEMFNNVLDGKSRMEYNSDTGQYEKAVLLKQGNYNYQYLFVPSGSARGETAALEGDFYQTQNEYAVYVYYRPMNARYDRLIGMTVISNAMNVL